MNSYSFVLNGEPATVVASSGTSLLSVLRDGLRLYGSKEACGRGECGACTVIHGRDSVASCMIMIDLVTEPVWTIEGIAERMADLRGSWIDSGGMQCGFCTPGFIARAAVVAPEKLDGQAGVRQAFSGNICRCTGYTGLVNALLSQRRPESGTGDD